MVGLGKTLLRFLSTGARLTCATTCTQRHIYQQTQVGIEPTIATFHEAGPMGLYWEITPTRAVLIKAQPLSLFFFV